jgi:PAS domain S-box-containing protein
MPKTPNASTRTQRQSRAEKHSLAEKSAPVDVVSSPNATLTSEIVNRISELNDRPRRPSNYKLDADNLASLSQKLTTSPNSFSENLAETLLKVCKAGSAFAALSSNVGVSFDRIAVAGDWNGASSKFTNEIGKILASVSNYGEPALFVQPHLDHVEFRNIKPAAHEILIVPVRIGRNGSAVIGIVSHIDTFRFDSEDFRQLGLFSAFGAAAASLLLGADTPPTAENGSESDGKPSPHTLDERFSRFMQNLPGLAWIKDDEGRYVYVNDVTASMFGRSRNEILGNTDISMFPKETAHLFIDNDRKVLESGSGFQTEEMLRDPTGLLRHSLVTKFPIPDPETGRVMVGGMAIDITERRQIEKDNTFLFTIAEMIRLGTDAVNLLEEIASAVGVYLNVEQCLFFELPSNENAAHLLAGYSRSGQGKPPSFDLTGYSSVNRQAMAMGRTVVNRNSETDPRTAESFAAVYGPNREISYISVPLMRQSNWVAEFCCIDAVARNWTDLEVALFETVGERAWAAVEKLRAESALRESEERFREMANGLPLSVWMHDKHGNQEFINRTFSEYFGVTLEETKANNWQALVHPDDVDAYTAEFRAAFENRTKFHAETRVLNSSDEWRWVESWAQPRMSDTGEFLGMIGASADVNDRRAAMVALRESEARLGFAIDIGKFGTWDIDFTDGSMIWSERLFEIFGMTPTDGFSIDFDQFEAIVHPDDFKWISELTLKAIEDRQEYTAEYRIYRNDTGELRWVSAAARFVYDSNGNVKRCVGIARDVTDRKIGEDLLRSSQERLTLAQNAGNVGIWDWNSSGQMYWSDKMWELYGEPVGKTALTDKFWKDRIHPEDRERVAEMIRTALSSGKTEFRDEFRIFRKRGEVRWLEVIATVEHDTTGRATRMYGVNLDVTEKKEFAERLKANEAQLRMITDAVPALISYVGSDERYRFVNKRYLEWFGVPQEEIVGKKMRSIVGNRAYQTFKPYIDEALSGVSSSFDSWAHYKGAGRRYVHVSYVPDIDQNGKTLGFHVLVTDLTELRRSEDLLRSSEERMRILSDSFTDYAIVAMDIEGRIESWNPGAENIFGFEEQEILGQPIDGLFTPEDVMKGVPLKEMRIARQKGKADDERWHIRKDGTRFFASGVTAPLYFDGVLAGYAKIATDLTEKKRNAEALQRAHDEMEFRVVERTRELAAMNEALLTEINVRKTAERQKIDLLRRIVSTQEDERRRIARDLHDHLGQRLTALRLKLASLRDEYSGDDGLNTRIARLQQIAHLLDSEVSFLTWELRPSALDELGLVEAIHTFVKEWSRHYDTEAEFHASGMSEAAFRGDAEIQVYRIVQEALNNIVKHASATRVGVILERTDDTATLIIEDNGVGFDTSITAHPDRTIGGAGIAGMHERAELIDGKLEIESSIGNGTSIFVKVPLKPNRKSKR